MTETETTFSFDDLDERAKDRAREAYTSDNYLDYDWYDAVYEDAVRMGKLLGVEISNTSRTTTKGKTVYDTNIYFSGFSSQGDGASFKGNYWPAKDAIHNVMQETNDEELLRIATELTLMQLTQRLNGLEFFCASINQSGHYSHSHTMSVEIHEHGVDEIGEPDEEHFERLMRDLADWIYKNLEAEYDWLHSDECVDEYLRDLEFDEEGVVV